MNKDFFEEFEIDLTGTCCLGCDRCSRNYLHSQHMVKKNIRSIEEIIKQLDEYKNLKRCSIAGQVSEPSLYPDFIPFLKYLKGRNISVNLFTNASILNPKLFANIGKILKDTDRVYFTICGSTQELHETYRKNSKLSTILENAKALREVNPIDYCQYIRFTYNLDDWRSNKWKQLGFTHYFYVETEGPRLFNKSVNPIKTKPVESFFYKKVFDYIKNGTKFTYLCRSEQGKRIYIDQFGKVYPCIMMAEYIKENFFDNFSYDKISDYYCCKLCSKEVRELMKKYNLEFIC